MMPLEPTNGAVIDDQAGAEQGRGGVDSKPRNRSRRAGAVTGKTRGRKLSLTDPVFERLQLAAIKKKTTVSAVAMDILDRNLPKLSITSE